MEHSPALEPAEKSQIDIPLVVSRAACVLNELIPENYSLVSTELRELESQRKSRQISITRRVEEVSQGQEEVSTVGRRLKFEPKHSKESSESTAHLTQTAYLSWIRIIVVGKRIG